MNIVFDYAMTQRTVLEAPEENWSRQPGSSLVMQAPAIEVAGVDLRPPFTNAESLSSFIAGTRMSKENVRNAFKYLTTYIKTTSFLFK